MSNLIVSNPVYFAGLTFGSATGTNMTVSGAVSTTVLTVSNTSTLSGPALLGGNLQFTTVGDNNIYFANNTSNYLKWNNVAGRFEMAPALSINGTASSTALIVNGNATTTGNQYIGGTLTANSLVSLTTSTFDNLIVSGYVSSSQLYISGTSTLFGPALLGSYLQFTTAGDNNIYFNNGASNYLKWNNALNRFELSNALNVNGTVTSTGLAVNGTANVTDLIAANSITLGGVARTTWPSGGGGGDGDGVWVTTTANVSYPDLPSPYAIVIGNSVTSSNVIFEVVGNSKFGGNVTITGNATSSGFNAANLTWTNATGTNLSWTTGFGANTTLTNATSTNFTFINATGTALNWTNATGTTLYVSNLLNANRLTVSNTSTLSGPVLFGGYAQFTTAGDNYLYFNNSANNYIKWDNANSRFSLSNGLNVNGTVSSTALQINGNASTTGNLYIGGTLTVNATSTFSTTSIKSLLLADGTAAKPSLAFLNDLGVGLYHPTGDGLAFSTNGAERMRILTNGNIGINTTTPGSMLTLNNGDIEIVSGTARMIMGSGAFPNHVGTTDASGLTTNANGLYKSGLITEVNGQLLSFAINASQLGDRNTSTIGAIFRLDTRTGYPYWSLKRQAVGGSTEYSDFQISTAGDMGVGAGHASDSNSFAGQLHIIPKNSTTTALVIQGNTDQSADLTQWRDSSNNILGRAKKLSNNFGLAMESGAFIGYNSYWADEFSADRANITYDGGSWGDSSQWLTAETGSCTWQTDDDAVNGISSMTAQGTNDVCALYLADYGATTPRTIFNTANLPVVSMKVRFSSIGGVPDDQRYFWSGLSTFGTTGASEGSAVNSESGVWFSNCFSQNQESSFGTDCDGNLYGVARDGSDANTSVTASCGAISETDFMYLMIKVVSSTQVEYWTDMNVADGINPTLCGTLTTNITTDPLSGFMGVAQDNVDNDPVLETDYFRVWQDDSATNTGLVWDNSEIDPEIDSEAAPELTFEEKTALDVNDLFTIVSSTRNTLADLAKLISDNSAQTAQANEKLGELIARFDGLDATASSTASMLSGLDTRVVVLENSVSSTAGSLIEIRDQISGIQYSISNIATSTIADSLQGNAINLSANSVASLVVEETAEFKGKVVVIDQVMLGEDSVGQAKILAGASSTTITFAKPYDNLPIITITPIGLHNFVYGVDNISTSSFMLLIDPMQDMDVVFNWHAFGSMPETKIFVSDGTASTVNIKVIDEPVAPPVIPPEETVIPSEAEESLPSSTPPDASAETQESLSLPVIPSEAEESLESSVIEPAESVTLPEAPVIPPEADLVPSEASAETQEVLAPSAPSDASESSPDELSAPTPPDILPAPPEAPESSPPTT
ncbi:hypothetical protein KKC87_02385 [Patescibacteria group bacterium]|nr:hypothetical protein [Patescibacteria group bacterium]